MPHAIVRAAAAVNGPARFGAGCGGRRNNGIQQRRSFVLRFNHVANRVADAHFDTIVGLFRDQLGFVELNRNDRAIWMRQPGANIDLQFSRVATSRDDAERNRSQVSFLSDTPRSDLEKLAIVLRSQGLRAEVGAYSEREFYLDVPEALVDFVIEAMLPELAVYAVDV